eukprot:1665647-Amphidinium_carterae.1
MKAVVENLGQRLMRCSGARSLPSFKFLMCQWNSSRWLMASVCNAFRGTNAAAFELLGELYVRRHAAVGAVALYDRGPLPCSMCI